MDPPVMTTTLLAISSIHWLYVAGPGCVNEAAFPDRQVGGDRATDAPERKT
jgi:hypothetical protein